MTVDIQTAQEHSDLAPSKLIEESLRRGEGMLSDTGALLITTGKRTGRSPADRFVVK
jgi:phosphoenolpyruvate carboxykinase (ATP)